MVLAQTVTAEATKTTTSPADRVNAFRYSRRAHAEICRGNLATITYSCEIGHFNNRCGKLNSARLSQRRVDLLVKPLCSELAMEA
jgi:hypothetical protein